jgi:hypothetical protein
VKKYAGPFTKLIPSQSASRRSSNVPAAGIRYAVGDFLIRKAGCALASMAMK